MRKVFIFTAFTVFFFHQCAQQPVATKDEYYSANDFPSVKKFDTHIHLNTLQPAFIHQAAVDNVQFLNIVDDRPFGITMHDQEQIAIKQSKTYPEQIIYATTFSTKNFNQPGWHNEVFDSLEQSFKNGAVAVKVWKNIGMDLKDADGNFVMIDHPKFDTIISYLAKKRITLIGHLGEPRECWLPLDSMVLHKDYYSSHPEYHMYLHPEYPSYEKQVESRNNMLAKHPDLKFIGAHLGSIEWNLDELAKTLDKYPNMAVDLARWTNLYLHSKNDRDKTRDFCIKYQDRLLYATDVQVNQTDDTAALKKNAHDSRMRYWKFLATDEQMTDVKIGEFQGLQLPKEVIDKIYYSNARRWLGTDIMM